MDLAWLDGQSLGTLTQIALSSDADNVETAQEEESQIEKVSKDIDNDEKNTIDETISQALAMPAELGLIKPAAPAAAPAELGAPAPKPAESSAKTAADSGVPAELGFGPGGPGGDGSGNGNAKHSMDSNWPLDRFPDGLYAPEGVPYPLKKATKLGPFNKWTGLHDNPDGTKSFPDGTIVDAPNTWLMTDDDVVPVDDYKEELSMAEEEAHALEIQNAKNEAAFEEKQRRILAQ
jgi:hypothetical protein